MAKATVSMPTDFLMQLSKLGERTDEIVEAALEAGGAVVLDAVKSNLQSAVGRGTHDSKTTGELVRSLGMSKPRHNRDGSGTDVKVGFAEPRSDGCSNAKIAHILEYGRPGKQPPRPFMKPARRKSEKQCVEAMRAVFEKEVGTQ